jgi:L-lactate dehydrogenase complex protein LldG
MSDARANILARLRAAPRDTGPNDTGPNDTGPSRPDWTVPTSGDGRLERFRTMLEAVHGEVHVTTATDWPDLARTLLAGKEAMAVLTSSALVQRLAPSWRGPGPSVRAYDRPVEEMKDALVHLVQAGLTWAKAGIAETGTLVLWPDPDEPRLLSLLPPIHVALLKASTLVDTLGQVMESQDWAGTMPTNALLISGPSKTADIEQTLAYGVHGPKELIVLILSDA